MITVSRLLVPTAIQAPPSTPPPPLPPPAHTGARLLHNLDLLPAGIVSSGRIRGFPAAVRNQGDELSHSDAALYHWGRLPVNLVVWRRQ